MSAVKVGNHLEEAFANLPRPLRTRSVHAVHYVYFVQSAVEHRRHYPGFTHHFRTRLACHNRGQK